MRYRVLPYKQGSKSAKALAEALGGKVLKLEGSKYIQAYGDVLINWGSSVTHPCLGGATPRCLNWPENIAIASNKLTFFQNMPPDIVPPFWTNREDIPDDAYPVVCRTILSGHSGAGIVIAMAPDDLVDAPLYVKYIPKKEEYRVHLGKVQNFPHETPDGEFLGLAPSIQTICVQRKARRFDTPSEQVNWKVRNHSNGFVFVRNGVNPPEDVISKAKQALEATGLDFGGVDVIWNEQKERAYALEINTACGLEGQTVLDYANYFKNAVFTA